MSGWLSGPRAKPTTLPSSRTTAASVFEPPPSTAKTVLRVLS
jgi:hypothetical protein